MQWQLVIASRLFPLYFSVFQSRHAVIKSFNSCSDLGTIKNEEAHIFLFLRMDSSFVMPIYVAYNPAHIANVSNGEYLIMGFGLYGSKSTFACGLSKSK